MRKYWRTNSTEEQIADFFLDIAWLLKELATVVVKVSYTIGRTLLSVFLPKPDCAEIGNHIVSGIPTWRVTIPYSVRPRGIHIIGPMGSGKSVLMKRLAIEDMQSDATVIVIDPKGDTAKALLGHIPDHRQQEVVYLDLTDSSMPIGLNVLQKVPPHLRTRATSDVVMTFKKLFRKSWGVRMEHFLRMGVATLLEAPEPSTLLDIPRLFLNNDYRMQILAQINNPMVRRFWDEEYLAIVNRRSFFTVIEPIINKLSMLNFPEVGCVIGQANPRLDLQKVIRSGGTVLAHIPQSFLGEDVSQFLCALFFTKVQLITMSQPSGDSRRLTIVHADEFQTYLSGSFEKAMTEGRSFNLCLCLAHQFSQQLDRSLQQAINHNVAVRLTCQVERGRHSIWYQRLQEPSHNPELLSPLPLLGTGDPQIVRAVRSSSRKRYGRSKQEVEFEIAQHFTPNIQIIPRQYIENKESTRAIDIWSN